MLDKEEVLRAKHNGHLFATGVVVGTPECLAELSVQPSAFPLSACLRAIAVDEVDGYSKVLDMPEGAQIICTGAGLLLRVLLKRSGELHSLSMLQGFLICVQRCHSLQIYSQGLARVLWIWKLAELKGMYCACLWLHVRAQDQNESLDFVLSEACSRADREKPQLVLAGATLPKESQLQAYMHKVASSAHGARNPCKLILLQARSAVSFASSSYHMTLLCHSSFVKGAPSALGFAACRGI